MTKLNFLSTASLLLAGALAGLTLGACDLGPKTIGNETEGAKDCEEGATKPADDGCNTCSCIDGAWGCTEKACGGQSTAPAECQDGEMMPAPDGCNTCVCSGGSWGCTEKACEDMTSSTSGGHDTDVPMTSSSSTAPPDDPMGSATEATSSTGDLEQPDPDYVRQCEVGDFVCDDWGCEVNQPHVKLSECYKRCTPDEIGGLDAECDEPERPFCSQIGQAFGGDFHCNGCAFICVSAPINQCGEPIDACE